MSILSVAEKNLVAVCSSGIEEVCRLVQGIDIRSIASGISGSAPQSNAQPTKQPEVMFYQCRRLLEIAQRMQTAIPSELFSMKIAKIFGLDLTRDREWNQLAKPLIQAYDIAIGILHRPSPHLVAYNSALNAAFRGVRSSSQNDEAAVINARRDIGSPPGGKQKYAVQSIAHLVRIKHQLAELASTFAEREHTARQWEFALRFSFLGYFLLESASQDAVLARRWAVEADLTRQALNEVVLVYRSQFLLFRHVSSWETKDIGFNYERRQALYERSIANEEGSYQEAIAFIQNEIDPVFLCDEKEFAWLEDNINIPLKQIKDDWSECACNRFCG